MGASALQHRGPRPEVPWVHVEAPIRAIWTHLDQTCCGVPPLLKVLLTVLLLNFQGKARPQIPCKSRGQIAPGDQSPRHLACTLLAPPSRPPPPAPSHQGRQTEGLHPHKEPGRAHSEHIWAQKVTVLPILSTLQ